MGTSVGGDCVQVTKIDDVDDYVICFVGEAGFVGGRVIAYLAIFEKSLKSIAL